MVASQVLMILAPQLEPAQTCGQYETALSLEVTCTGSCPHPSRDFVGDDPFGFAQGRLSPAGAREVIREAAIGSCFGALGDEVGGIGELSHPRPRHPSVRSVRRVITTPMCIWM